MIAGIASLVFIPLLAIAAAHAMWAFGSTWPARDEKLLAQTVAGFRGIERMPPRIASAGVALATFSAGIWALAMTDEAPGALLTAGGVLIGAVFLMRGVLGYTPWWRAVTPQEPFATMDRKFYSPLCLGLAAGFFLLAIWRLT